MLLWLRRLADAAPAVLVPSLHVSDASTAHANGHCHASGSFCTADTNLRPG